MEQIKKEPLNAPHNIIMEQRSKLVLSGVAEVISFEDENVELVTTKGKLTIRGNNLRMESFQSDIGDLVMQGDIYAIVYLNDNSAKSGFFSRLLK